MGCSGQDKPKGFDQMKGRSRDYTGTPDIAGIAGYFRLMQYNVHCLSYFFPEFFHWLAPSGFTLNATSMEDHLC